MNRNKILGLGLPLILCIIMVGSSIGVVSALNINQLSPIKVSIFQQSYQPSQFSAFVLKTTLRRSQVTIQIRVTNNDASIHSANVTVSCYDATDNLLQEITQPANNVNSQKSVDITYAFNSVSQNSFSYCQIKIEDLS